jgi:hypothetical protein
LFGERPGFNSDSWWPASVIAIDLPRFPGACWEHVLVGDSNNGGHTRTALERWKRNGATAFPEVWDASQIGHAVEQVLASAARQYGLGANELWPGKHDQLVDVEGRRVLVRVWLREDGDLYVATTHPLRGDGVVFVDSGRIVSRPLHPDEG